MAQRTQPKEKRNKQIVLLRLAGTSFADIGRKLKISRSFAKQVFDRDLPKYRETIVNTLDKIKV